jgi:aldose 1-epimerase
MVPSGTQWTIEAGGDRAVVVEVGGGLRALSLAGEEILDGYAESELCPGSAGRVLAPWPNRVRDGRYAFGGREYQLPLTEPAKHNAIHGLANWVRWRRAVDDDGRPGMVSVEHELVPQPGYPWPLLLRTTWTVGGGELRAEHTATNLGGTPCPFGLATHPYLRIPGTAVEDLVLRIPGGQRLLLDGRSLPIGAVKVAGGEYDYSEGRRIGATVLDVAFGDLAYDGDGASAVRLSTPDGRGVEVWADGAFRWWQVFTGDTLAPERARRAVAIEPMTCPPDAFRSGRDVVVVEPGAAWRGAWGVRRLV